VEIVEHEGHPFMAGTQFHPEFLSRPTNPHPMFREFLGAVCEVVGDFSDGAGGALQGGNGADNLGIGKNAKKQSIRDSQVSSNSNA